MLGIMGGSGLYDPQLFSDVESHSVDTPYGKPSADVVSGTFEHQKVFFLARHGKGHAFNPTTINYRANIFALKSLGVTRVIGISAVGSLQENVHPGELVVLDQFIDRTTQRVQTFYPGPKVCHVSMAEPFCPELRKVVVDDLQQHHVAHHPKGTYVCIEGPRFSTKAESMLYKSWNAHVIGMTLVPECILAREAELCYSTLALVTDYDSFKEHPVSTEEVVRVMSANVSKAKDALARVIPLIPEKRSCACGEALKNAFM